MADEHQDGTLCRTLPARRRYDDGPRRAAHPQGPRRHRRHARRTPEEDYEQRSDSTRVPGSRCSVVLVWRWVLRIARVLCMAKKLGIASCLVLHAAARYRPPQAI